MITTTAVQAWNSQKPKGIMGREGWAFFPLPRLFLWMKRCALFTGRKTVLISEFSWVPFKKQTKKPVHVCSLEVFQSFCTLHTKHGLPLGLLFGLHSELGDHRFNLNGRKVSPFRAQPVFSCRRIHTQRCAGVLRHYWQAHRRPPSIIMCQHTDVLPVLPVIDS